MSFNFLMLYLATLSSSLPLPIEQALPSNYLDPCLFLLNGDRDTCPFLLFNLTTLFVTLPSFIIFSSDSCFILCLIFPTLSCTSTLVTCCEADLAHINYSVLKHLQYSTDYHPQHYSLHSPFLW